MSSLLAVGQVSPEALCEGLDPVVSQHHRLGQAEVELLLLGQIHPPVARSGEQLLQHLLKLLLRMV